jgi:uncharacterized delta-60 repeat protein
MPQKGFDSDVCAIELLADGKILVGGFFNSYGENKCGKIVRLFSDGTPDHTFQFDEFPDPKIETGGISVIRIQPDGKILVGNEFLLIHGPSSSAMFRLHPNGDRDDSFEAGKYLTGEPGILHSIYDIQLISDNRILVSGSFSLYRKSPNMGLLCLSHTGEEIPFFETGNGFDRAVNEIRVLPEGKLSVSGYFQMYNGKPQMHFVLFSAEGRLSELPRPDIDFLETPKILKVQPDGKRYVFGRFYDSSGELIETMVRLNADGSRDDGFTVKPDLLRRVTNMHVLEDGRILVAGSLRLEDELRRHRLIRLLPDGQLDSGFDTHKIIRSVMKSVYCMAVQPDGKILLGGDFNPFADESGLNLIRLHEDGSHDTTFETGEGFDKPVRCMVLQKDGKILVGGAFESYDGFLNRGIVRLLPNGRPDDSFDTGQGFAGPVNTLLSLPYGKMLAGGKFTSFNGMPACRIAMLNEDGSLQQKFDSASGFDDAVNTLALLTRNKVLAGGNFMSYGDKICNRIALLNLAADR